MKLDGLIQLYKSMRSQDIGRTKFRYQHNHLTFDCLFFIDVEPFELVMGCIGRNFAIFLEIEKGFNIQPFIEPKSTFFDLLNALKTDKKSDNKFNPFEFFEEFNKQIPDSTKPSNTVKPKDIVKYVSNIEESDRIYFCGWLNNNLQKNQVSEKNLEKTKWFMGQRVYEFAKRRNQSTKWTDDESKARELFFP